MTIPEAFDSFLQRYNNQSVEKEDSSNLDQCFDLAFAWLDTLNIPRDTIRHQFAYQIYTDLNPDTSQYFDLIANGPTNAPQKGDLVVFDTTIGIAGHVCVATGIGDANGFESFDQNWDTEHFYHLDTNGNKIPYSRIVEHNYNGVIGWLRPKNISVPGNYYKGINLDNIDSVKVAIDTWDAVAHGQYIPIADWNAIGGILGLPAGSTNDAETVTQNLNKQIPDLTTRAETAEGKVKILTQQLEDEEKLAQNDQGNTYKDLYNTLLADYNAKRVIWDNQFKTDVAVFSQLKRNNIYYLSTGTIFSYWFQRITSQAKQNIPPPLTPEDFKYADSVPLPSTVMTNNGKSNGKSS